MNNGEGSRGTTFTFFLRSEYCPRKGLDPIRRDRFDALPTHKLSWTPQNFLKLIRTYKGTMGTIDQARHCDNFPCRICTFNIFETNVSITIQFRIYNTYIYINVLKYDKAYWSYCTTFGNLCIACLIQIKENCACFAAWLKSCRLKGLACCICSKTRGFHANITKLEILCKYCFTHILYTITQ